MPLISVRHLPGGQVGGGVVGDGIVSSQPNVRCTPTKTSPTDEGAIAVEKLFKQDII